MQILARREVGRLLWEGSSGGTKVLWIGLTAGLVLLIPLHQAFGELSPTDPPYLLLFALLVQLAGVVLSAVSTWSSMRRDLASGRADELLLTGMRPSHLALGKWLGGSAGAAAVAVALLPPLLIASASGAASPGGVAWVVLAWALASAAGCLLGARLAQAETSAGWTLVPVVCGVQGWLLIRFAGGLFAPLVGPAAVRLHRALMDADPLALIPAALGLLPEPVWPKAVSAAVLLLAGAGHLALSAGEFHGGTAGAGHSPEFIALRPLRERRGTRSPAPEYGAGVLFAFEWAFGPRLRLTRSFWLCVLGVTALPALPLAILGPDGRSGAALLGGAEVWIVSALAALGAAASVALDREQGRWAALLSLPIPVSAVLRAKWRASWLESWPVWVGAAARTLALAAAGTLSWSSVAPALLAPPLAAAISAAAALALSTGAPSLLAAQMRAAAWVTMPLLLAACATLLLPGLPGSGFISLAHTTHRALAVPESAGAAVMCLLLWGLAAGGVLLLAERHFVRAQVEVYS